VITTPSTLPLIAALCRFPLVRRFLRVARLFVVRSSSSSFVGGGRVPTGSSPNSAGVVVSSEYAARSEARR